MQKHCCSQVKGEINNKLRFTKYSMWIFTESRNVCMLIFFSWKLPSYCGGLWSESISFILVNQKTVKFSECFENILRFESFCCCCSVLVKQPNVHSGAVIRGRVLDSGYWHWWQVTGDRWQVTGDRSQVTCDMWHMTCNTWHVICEILVWFSFGKWF